MEKMIDIFMKHIVSITWLDYNESYYLKTKDLAKSDVREFAISAFMINISDRCLLITAGHILKDLEKRIKSGRKIFSSRIIDTYFSDSYSTPAIPFVLEDAPRFYIFEDGLDYGVILLRPNYAQLLMAGNKIFLDQKYWDDVPDDMDGYCLLGFPTQAMENEKIENENSCNIKFGLNIPMIPVDRVSNPPKALQAGNDRFYAKLPIITRQLEDREEEITDIDGMSGGPIFGFKYIDEQRIKYWIIAVQSSWLKSEKVIAACYISPLAHAIIKAVDEKLKK